MAKIITSPNVTFMDTTDNRKLDVYITSNLPTVQIKNLNTNPVAYTPNWASTPLVLEADAYLDSQDVNNKTTFSWYKKNALGVETLINANAKTITINNNALDDGQLVVYVCKALYKSSDADNGIEDTEQITFSQVTTGLDGTNGTPAPAVQAQYSANGTSGWTATLNTATHKYIRYSYDGGISWTVAIKMVGEDGTSVNIKGTATSKTAVSNTPYFTLVYNEAPITGATLGDAYLLDGNMYVCVDSKDGNDYFMDVGRIQGPQGNDGQSSYVFIRYATNISGANMTATPTSATTHIGICTVNTNVAPTTANSYTWSKFVGDSAKSIILTGSAQVFKVSKTNVYTPSAISVTATSINTVITEWTYSVNGGQTFLSTVPTGVVRNGNIVTVTGSTFTSNSLVIKASDGQYSDVFTIYKAFDGADGTPGSPGTPASMAFLTNENISFSANENGQVALTSFTTNVVAYNGTTKVTPVIGTITGLPTGMTVSVPTTTANELILTFSIANNSTLGSTTSTNGTITIPITSPVSTSLKLSWSKINSGATGVGIKSTTVSYGVSDSSSTQPTDWKSAMPTVAEGKYLWTRTIIDYTDDNVPDTVTYIYAKQGEKGTIGDPGNSATVSSIQYQEGASATTAPTGTWSNAVVAVADGKYLWTKTTFSDSKVAYGVAKQGEKGNKGTSIKEVDIAYAIHSNPTNYPSSGWEPTIPTPDKDRQYLWTRTTFTLEDGTSNSAYSVVKQGRGIDKITEYYLVTNVASGVTKATSGWKDTVQTVTATSRYLWNYEEISYTDGTSDSTDPIVIGVYGDKGNTGGTGPTGNGIASIEEWYLATSASSGVTTSTGEWTKDIQLLTSQNKYLWNYEIITYTNGNKVPTTPVIIGVYGDKGDKGNTGDDAYTVILTNESNTFVGDISNALAGQTTTQVLAYKKAAKQTVTISTVNGVAASTSVTNTGIAGLTFQCSALSGTEPTITFKCTTAFVSPNGTIPIVLNVGGISFTKMFTYSIAFKGATGGQGNQGNPGSPATAYWLVSSAGVVQKTSTGTVVLTPSTLTFTGKSKTGTNAPIDYGCRWIIAYSTDGTNYTDAYTSTANETSKVFTVGATYKAVRARMYLAGGTTTLLDEQIIPVVADGATGAPGDDAVTFQIYSSNGYALSINTPSITLQTFAYIGDVQITADATYQWYAYNDAGWTAVTGATKQYLVVSRDDVAFSKSYMCKMTFNGVEYTSVATIDDKNDENRIFAKKPSNYSAGDLWIVGVDYAPTGIEIGTLLRAEHTNTSYADTDWVTATKYDDKIDSLQESLSTYDQYFSLSATDGLKISARDANGTESKFSTSLTNERLSFNYGNESVAYINGTKMNIKEAEIESPLTVTGKYSGSTMLQAPVINIGNFSIIVESNGSLSIVANT